MRDDKSKTDRVTNTTQISRDTENKITGKMRKAVEGNVATELTICSGSVNLRPCGWSFYVSRVFT